MTTTASLIGSPKLGLMKIFQGTFLPAGSAAGSSADIVLTHGPIFGFFAPQERHVAPIKVKFGREERTVGPLLPI